MAKNYDASWFDLKKYDGLENLDLKGWQEQIHIRHVVEHHITANNGYFLHQAVHFIDRIKKNPIIASEGHNSPRWGRDSDWVKFYHPHLTNPLNTFSVMNTPPMSCWLDGANFAHAIIDLSATDEQIKKDFAYWLAENRKAIGYISPDKNVTENKLKDWYQWRLLPYLDLNLAAKSEGKEITQCEMGKLIFPNEYEKDLTERIRKTTKPKAEELMRTETLTAIGIQLHSYQPKLR